MITAKTVFIFFKRFIERLVIYIVEELFLARQVRTFFGKWVYWTWNHVTAFQRLWPWGKDSLYGCRHFTISSRAIIEFTFWIYFILKQWQRWVFSRNIDRVPDIGQIKKFWVLMSTGYKPEKTFGYWWVPGSTDHVSIHTDPWVK